MIEDSGPIASGVLTLHFPISIGNGLPATEIFCERWGFRTDQGLGIQSFESRGPVQRALFAVAFSPPVNDAAVPGRDRSDILALIPMENVLGWVASDKAPPTAARIGPEAHAP